MRLTAGERGTKLRSPELLPENENGPAFADPFRIKSLFRSGFFLGIIALNNRKFREEMKEKILAFIKKKYGVVPEHPWKKYPENKVFRHSDNKKWFALMMEVQRSKLGFPDDDYVKDMFFGISNHQTVLENIIGRYSQNWSAKRISRVSYAAMCISIYEMVKREDIPVKVSINEAVQISKDFDEEKASPFVNGILNSVKDDLESIRHEF